MSRLTVPSSPRGGVLVDPRSTGASSRPRLSDILGLRGTLVKPR